MGYSVEVPSGWLAGFDVDRWADLYVRELRVAGIERSLADMIPAAQALIAAMTHVAWSDDDHRSEEFSDVLAAISSQSQLGVLAEPVLVILFSALVEAPPNSKRCILELAGVIDYGYDETRGELPHGVSPLADIRALGRQYAVVFRDLARSDDRETRREAARILCCVDPDPSIDWRSVVEDVIASEPDEGFRTHLRELLDHPEV